MDIVITDTAKEDIKFFLKSGQTSLVKKIEKLLISIQTSPFTAICKPEPLKYEFSGKWSRRIDSQHRVIYEVIGESIIIESVK